MSEKATIAAQKVLGLSSRYTDADLERARRNARRRGVDAAVIEAAYLVLTTPQVLPIVGEVTIGSVWTFDEPTAEPDVEVEVTMTDDYAPKKWSRRKKKDVEPG